MAKDNRRARERVLVCVCVCVWTPHTSAKHVSLPFDPLTLPTSANQTTHRTRAPSRRVREGACTAEQPPHCKKKRSIEAVVAQGAHPACTFVQAPLAPNAEGKSRTGVCVRREGGDGDRQHLGE